MKKHTLRLPEGDTFSPSKTFNCGQCFRFNESEEDFRGIVNGALVIFPKKQPVGKIEYFTSGEALDRFLDAKQCYADINAALLKSFPEHFELIKSAVDISAGLRILKQNFFETLISFIISQNNNIPRIKKNVEAISALLGNEFYVGDNVYHAFPTPKQILEAGASALDFCKLGFRTKYILDAAEKVLSGEIDESVTKEKLMTIHGVGPKVASCVMLYGLHDLSDVPVDVWMKKVFLKYFNADFVNLGEFGGVLQQYLFFRERYIIEGKKI